MVGSPDPCDQKGEVGDKVSEVIIYVLIDPRNNKVRYVGQTEKKLSARLSQHIYGRFSARKGFWFEDMKADGVKPIIKQVMRVSKDKSMISEDRIIRKCLAHGCDLVNVNRSVYDDPVRMKEAALFTGFECQTRLLEALKKDRRVRYAMDYECGKGYSIKTSVLIEWHNNNTMRRKPGRPADKDKEITTGDSRS